MPDETTPNNPQQFPHTVERPGTGDPNAVQGPIFQSEVAPRDLDAEMAQLQLQREVAQEQTIQSLPPSQRPFHVGPVSLSTQPVSDAPETAGAAGQGLRPPNSGLRELYDKLEDLNQKIAVAEAGAGDWTFSSYNELEHLYRMREETEQRILIEVREGAHRLNRYDYDQALMTAYGYVGKELELAGEVGSLQGIGDSVNAASNAHEAWTTGQVRDPSVLAPNLGNAGGRRPATSSRPVGSQQAEPGRSESPTLRDSESPTHTGDTLVAHPEGANTFTYNGEVCFKAEPLSFNEQAIAIEVRGHSYEAMSGKGMNGAESAHYGTVRNSDVQFLHTAPRQFWESIQDPQTRTYLLGLRDSGFVPVGPQNAAPGNSGFKPGLEGPNQINNALEGTKGFILAPHSVPDEIRNKYNGELAKQQANNALNGHNGSVLAPPSVPDVIKDKYYEELAKEQAKNGLAGHNGSVLAPPSVPDVIKDRYEREQAAKTAPSDGLPQEAPNGLTPAGKNVLKGHGIDVDKQPGHKGPADGPLGQDGPMDNGGQQPQGGAAGGVQLQPGAGDVPVPPWLQPLPGGHGVGPAPLPPSYAPGYHEYTDPETGETRVVDWSGPSNNPMDPQPGWWGYDPKTGKTTWHPHSAPPPFPDGQWLSTPQGYIFMPGAVPAGNNGGGDAPKKNPLGGVFKSLIGAGSFGLKVLPLVFFGYAVYSHFEGGNTQAVVANQVPAQTETMTQQAPSALAVLPAIATTQQAPITDGFVADAATEPVESAQTALLQPVTQPAATNAIVANTPPVVTGAQAPATTEVVQGSTPSYVLTPAQQPVVVEPRRVELPEAGVATDAVQKQTTVSTIAPLVVATQPVSKVPSTNPTVNTTSTSTGTASPETTKTAAQPKTTTSSETAKTTSTTTAPTKDAQTAVLLDPGAVKKKETVNTATTLTTTLPGPTTMTSPASAVVPAPAVKTTIDTTVGAPVITSGGSSSTATNKAQSAIGPKTTAPAPVANSPAVAAPPTTFALPGAYTPSTTASPTGKYTPAQAGAVLLQPSLSVLH